MKIGNFFETRKLTPEEKTEYRKLNPGIYVTHDMIRSVAVDNGVMEVLEITQNMSLTTLRVNPK